MTLAQDRPPKALTIGGSDSGGAAGLQADLKTFTALKAYGMSVVTAVTAQNSLQVKEIHFLDPEFVLQQINAVLSDYGADAVKIGFVGRSDLIEVIGTRLADYQGPDIVVDPVLVDHRGRSMFPADVLDAYRQRLFPIVRLATPNRSEAALLSRINITSLSGMDAAAKVIQAMGPRWVLVKGGKVEGDALDLLTNGRQVRVFRTPWIETTNTHGSGDTLSAAISVFLALGASVPEAVDRARRFTHQSIKGAVNWHLGAGHGPLNHFNF